MATTNFTSGAVIESTWLNDVDAATYEGAAIFTPAGTGAVSRTVQAKLRESVSVKDFGAVGDGVTDDTAAIQAAIDYLATQGSGTLIFPRNYTFGISDTIYVKSNIQLLGDGMPVIKAISAFSGAMVQFGFTTAVITDPDTNVCNNSSIENIEIDGDYLVTGRDWDPGNLLAAGLDSALVYVWRDSKYNRIINCKVHSAECDLIGVEDGADFVEVKACKVYDATTFSAATQFINLINIDGPQNAVLDGNHCYDLLQSGYSPASWGYALRLHATDGAVVRNNYFVSGWNVVLVDGRSNLILNNTISGGGARGLYLFENSFGCRYNSIVSNYVDGNALTGIQEQSSADVEFNYIAFNTVRNASTPLSVPTGSKNSIVLGNQVFDVGGTRQAELTRLNLNKGSTVDSGSTLTSGTWSPGTIDNTSNTSGTAISAAQYTRVGDIVFISGVATTTLAASGTYELRFSPPIASTFDAAGDAIGTANDNFSSYGNFSAFTSGTPRVIRVLGTAASSGAKTIRFTGSYIVK